MIGENADFAERGAAALASILVVDDDANLAETVKAMLIGSGHQVRSESKSGRVLEIILGESFDLIISDIFMPEFDGIELIAKVNEISPSTKVLVMTGGARNFPTGSAELTDITSIAEMLGASGVLTKPFRRKHLLDAINKLL